MKVRAITNINYNGTLYRCGEEFSVSAADEAALDGLAVKTEAEAPAAPQPEASSAEKNAEKPAGGRRNQKTK